MKNITQITAIVFISLCVDLFGQPGSLFNEGIAALNKNDISAAKNLFKESVGKYRDAASAYRLALILLKEDTYKSRNDALEYFKQAALREPGNMDYRFGYALLLEQLAINSALHEYENILKEHPRNSKALTRLGFYYLADYNTYKNTFKMPYGAERTFDLEEENKKDYTKAEKYFNEAIGSDSANSEAYTGLCRLYENANEDSKAIDLLTKIERIDPANRDIHLYLGMLYNRNGKIKKAGEEFQKALDLMNKEEREDFIYNSVKLLLDPIINFNDKSFTKEKIEELIARFWKKSNPLIIAEDNQRLLEHYSRMAYANLHFGAPAFKVIGWKTDRGEVYIRYGHPNGMNKILMGASLEGTGGGRSVYWYYDNFMLQFDNKYMSGNYKLHTEEAIERDYAYFFDRYKKKVFQTYNAKGKQFKVNKEIYSFKNQDEKSSTKYDTYLAFELPIRDSLGRFTRIYSHYEYGIFVFDNEFNTLTEKRSKSNEAGITPILKDKRNKDKTDIVKLNIPDGTVSFSFEMRKLADSSFFSYSGSLSAPAFKLNELEMSDAVLAQDVSTGEEIKGAIKRNDIYIAPKVRKRIDSKEQVFLYYEVYDLKVGKDSLTSFEQIITIKKKDLDDNDGSLVGTIFRGVKNLFGKDSKVSLSSNYKTKEINPQQYLQLDFSEYPSGYYDMVITVHDKNSGSEVERTLSFEIINSGKTK